MTADDGTGSAVDEERATALDLADPRLYRTNVFRTTGLAVDATTSAVRRRRQDLRMAEALGTPAAATTPGRHPLDPPPDTAAVRDAFAAIKDPARRLHDEVFWFWGSAQAAPEPTVDRHDHAVEAHLRALDLEEAATRAPLSAEDAAERDRAWEVALRTWAEVLDDDGFWTRVRTRVREIDDPRLTTGAVRRMRTELAPEILLTSVRTVVEADSDAVADRHRALLDGAPFARETVEQARRGGVDPLLRAVGTATREAYPRLARAASADEIREALRRLHVEVDPALRGMTRVLGAGDRSVQGAADEVAQVLVQAGVAIHNLGADGDRATSPAAAREGLAVLAQAQALAGRPATVARIDDQVTAVSDNIVWLALRRDLRAERVDRARAVLVAWRRRGDVPAVRGAIDRLLAQRHGLMGPISAVPTSGMLYLLLGTVIYFGRPVDEYRQVATKYLAFAGIPLVPLASYLADRRREQRGWRYHGRLALSPAARWWRIAVAFALLLWITSPIPWSSPVHTIVLAIPAIFLLLRFGSARAEVARSPWTDAAPPVGEPPATVRVAPAAPAGRPGPPAPAPPPTEDELLDRRVVVLAGELDDDTANGVMAGLLVLDEDTSAGQIVLHVDSPGGLISAARAVVETMAALRCDVTTCVTGTAAGVAQVVASAGSPGKRWALPHARILAVAPSETTRQALDGLVAARGGLSPDGDLAAFYGQWITAVQAVEYGLLDGVVAVAPGLEA